ncbi:MAG: lactoylglutathione lyase [Planctomycetota bacterium]
MGGLGSFRKICQAGDLTPGYSVLIMKRILLASLLASVAWNTPQDKSSQDEAKPAPASAPASSMNLGGFSVSLAVKDLAASRAFYEKLGFEQAGGVPEQNWLILRNGTTVVGLFQGMFEDNILTFNPGWASVGEHPKEFTDIRDLEKKLVELGITPVVSIPAGHPESGPASVVLADPDGNTILLDQHR